MENTKYVLEAKTDKIVLNDRVFFRTHFFSVDTDHESTHHVLSSYWLVDLITLLVLTLYFLTI